MSTWSKLEGKSEENLSATIDGKLILPNAAGCDSDAYKCSASNILRQVQALVRLAVNGKFLFVGSERTSDNTEDRKEAMKLYRNSSYPGIHLQKHEEGKGFCYSHLHVLRFPCTLLHCSNKL